jgi:riboflavin synthase
MEESGGVVFTGIVEQVGEVTEAAAGVIRVRAGQVVDDARPGESVALDGVDLTVTEITGTELAFNVMPETYRQTTMGRYRAGSRVNLERSLRAEDRLSGHVVRGVVEGTGTLAARAGDGDAVILTYEAPRDLLARILERGPVCVDGVSLTVIRKTSGIFAVSVVDYTQRHTNLLDRRVGDLVNIETDNMMRYVLQAVHELDARRLRPDD